MFPRSSPSTAGEYLARSRDVRVLEGLRDPPDVALIFRFPNTSAISDFLMADAYQPFKQARKKGSRTEILAFESDI